MHIAMHAGRAAAAAAPRPSRENALLIRMSCLRFMLQESKKGAVTLKITF